MNLKPKALLNFFLGFGIHIWITLFVVNFVVFEAIRYFSNAQNSCMTMQQIQSDNRCLYIYNGKIYEKGTKSDPHQGHPCGSDVTQIIPATHLAGIAQYLDPNYKATVCTANTTSPTTVPTRI